MFQFNAEKLGFRYEDQTIFQQLSFSIDKNESVLLLGPSGSGKSTLAYCLNKLYPEAVDGVLDGNLMFEGRLLEEYKPGEINQKIGMVFQDPDSQFCMLTVEEEVAFGLENLNIPREEMEEKIDRALELVGMKEYKQATIHTLSGGQKQKLAFACVLALKPEVIILDEPTANLDPISSQELVETIALLKKEFHFTLIVIEHKLDNWLEIINRCLVLDASGTIIFDGEPSSCFREHAHFLQKEGIWLPKVVDAGLKAKNTGTYTGENLPLTMKELVNGLEGPIDFYKKEKQPCTSSKPVLEVNGLNARGILKDIHFSIHEGELVALVGANGSGKTTLSKCLAGLLPSSHGEVRFQGVLLSHWKEQDLWKRLGYVFQNPEHQFITDRVYDEIAFGLDQKEIVTTTLKKLGLENHTNAHPFSLSQGQKRRLSVATMLVHDQDLLILDEPTFGQDAITASEIMQVLEEKTFNSGSVLMITHDMEQVEQYADRVLVLDEGGLIFSGTTESLWERADVLTKARLTLPFGKLLENERGRRGDYVLT
jgi:energy-coupling factor transport system ATP-binding protein